MTSNAQQPSSGQPDNHHDGIDAAPPPYQESLPAVPQPALQPGNQNRAVGGTQQQKTAAPGTGAPQMQLARLEDLHATPQIVDCPWCKTRQRTTVDDAPTGPTHIAAVLLCLFCGPCCAVLPYCCNSYFEITHYCAGCKHPVAKVADGKVIQVIRPLNEQGQAVAEQPGGNAPMSTAKTELEPQQG
ncbi:uncharacterized protein GGS25DRAFT_522592 [Hypoxylon fragiforme]|uniref:uncharacterized protein n=1 Tax=Hypoxylon fragiforme TaxID=63214 RepID=UPI0020C5F0A4|nr:uncharacterized protein GGS25DRAFT_522592 [Hypoxylon fragiforme]KAI2607076.1 hypothetical protein GGS25DRAFT_522592 [Hypoxylon fragiforme]